jgi:DNA polymerase
MEKIFGDFETKSGLDITEVGRQRYLHDPLADIICLAYRIGYTGKTKIWVPGMDLPEFTRHPQDFLHYYFNIQFDAAVQSILGKRYGMKPIPLSNQRDVMALVARYGLHQNLAQAGEDLGCKTLKMPSGKALIKKITQPPFTYTDQEYQEFLKYCANDVDSMIDVISALPTDKLSDYEQENWEMIVRMNQRGVPIDTEAVTQIIKVTNAFLTAQFERLPGLTNGVITKITQTRRIVSWAQSRGVDLPNCQAETIAKLVNSPEGLPDDVFEVLEMRDALGSSAIAKYKKLENLVYRGRIYDNSRYYGTHTGRTAGMGFQMLNLPRAKSKDPEADIKAFHDLSIIERNPVQTAKALIRSMIKAPDGKQICAADYSSIENILLLWLAGEEDGVESFRQGRCQYCEMASYLYNIPYEDIYNGHKAGDDEMSYKRFEGKVIILGCGYQLGANGFMGVAESWGMKVSQEYAEKGVYGFRSKYPKVVKLWKQLHNIVIAAIQSEGTQFVYRGVKAKVITDRNGRPWLRFMLPSERPLFFMEPKIVPGTFGHVPSHMGINPYTKKWCRKKMSPGRVTENAVQAIARDILMFGKRKLEEAGYEILNSVYDEVILEIEDRDHDEQLQDITARMCMTDTWAEGIPLRADGFVGPRYKKM